MSRIVVIALGAVLATVLLGFLTFRALNQPPGTTDVVPVPANILDSNVTDKIKDRDVNGNVPVKVDLDRDFGRDDPFAGI